MFLICKSLGHHYTLMLRNRLCFVDTCPHLIYKYAINKNLNRLLFLFLTPAKHTQHITSSEALTFSKQGRILSDTLMRMARMCSSCISPSTRLSPLMASMVMKSSGSSRSSMPAIMADSIVVAYSWTWGEYIQNHWWESLMCCTTGSHMEGKMFIALINDNLLNVF